MQATVGFEYGLQGENVPLIGTVKTAGLADAVSRIGKAIHNEGVLAREAMGSKLVARAPVAGATGKPGYQMAENTGVGDWLHYQGNRAMRRFGKVLEKDPHIAMGAGAVGTGLAGYGAYKAVGG